MIILPPAFAGLASYAQFVLWKHTTNKTGKPIKAVIDTEGRIYNALDPAIHMTFDTAATNAARLGCGIGFVLLEPIRSFV